VVLENASKNISKISWVKVKDGWLRMGIFLILLIKDRKVEPVLDIAYYFFLHYNILFGDTENIKKIYFSRILSFSLPHTRLSYFSHFCCRDMRNSVASSDRRGNNGHKLKHRRF